MGKAEAIKHEQNKLNFRCGTRRHEGVVVYYGISFFVVPHVEREHHDKCELVGKP